MFSTSRLQALVAVALLVSVAGCGDKPIRQVCMGGSGGGNSLIDGAAILRVDVYSTSSASCADGLLADGAGAPIMSHTYTAGEAIKLDVPPGPHVLVLTTYADAAGTQPLGQACTQATLQAGSQICFDLTVVPAPVGPDLSVLSCTVTPNSCPMGYWCDGTQCQPGCASDADCMNGGADGGATPTPYCDPVAHSCVQCTMTSQCGAMQTCNAGQCVTSCDATHKACNGVCIPQASCCNAGDCTAAPIPAACRVPTCSTAGGSCSYPQKPGSQICGTTCCNAVNGTCAANCTLSCTAGFADCNGDPADGCETNLAAAGKKLCNGSCIAQTSCCSSADCTTPPTPASCYGATGTCPAPGGTCTYTENSGSQICNNNTTCCNAKNGMCNSTCMLSCNSGFLDCNVNPTDGCETACNPTNPVGGCYSNGGVPTCCPAGAFNCNGANTCSCNTSCCTNPMTGTSDCLVKTHSDGYSHSFSACYPLGTPGTNSTAGVGYGLQMAQDAAAADTSIVGNCTADADCQPYAASATCVNGACIWPGGKCFSGQDYIQSLCKYTLAGNGKPSDCTCWAYAASAGTCNGSACGAAIGHTNHVTSNFCPCVAATNGTYQ